ncbi:Acetamidase/Formamidase family-domain-containing protein [Suillus plorans]|uniref:Acetamidase/Formamidase family-domain-containing protein n=1 Tax=Suillus plorans TaxID=116603 RepID=A0A9P7AVH3_9AGAM|nr:Acetamidase/Formamidase family-domain-containing protein [Suillus plorans]KAG1795987.1 Acetamidase/Formamidase family-domain-containing protein [Suillus plorans]
MKTIPNRKVVLVGATASILGFWELGYGVWLTGKLAWPSQRAKFTDSHISHSPSIGVVDEVTASAVSLDGVALTGASTRITFISFDSDLSPLFPTASDDIRDVDLTSVHNLSGPIAVEGAEPRDCLVVDILDVRPFDKMPWGYTGIFELKNGGRLFVGEWFVDRSKYIPLRLTYCERKYLRLLDDALQNRSTRVLPIVHLLSLVLILLLVFFPSPALVHRPYSSEPRQQLLMCAGRLRMVFVVLGTAWWSSDINYMQFSMWAAACMGLSPGFGPAWAHGSGLKSVNLQGKFAGLICLVQIPGTLVNSSGPVYAIDNLRSWFWSRYNVTTHLVKRFGSGTVSNKTRTEDTSA